MAQATEALRDFKAIANGAGVTRIVCVATVANARRWPCIRRQLWPDGEC